MFVGGRRSGEGQGTGQGQAPTEPTALASLKHLAHIFRTKPILAHDSLLSTTELVVGAFAIRSLFAANKSRNLKLA